MYSTRSMCSVKVTFISRRKASYPGCRSAGLKVSKTSRDEVTRELSPEGSIGFIAGCREKSLLTLGSPCDTSDALGTSWDFPQEIASRQPLFKRQDTMQFIKSFHFALAHFIFIITFLGDRHHDSYFMGKENEAQRH